MSTFTNRPTVFIHSTDSEPLMEGIIDEFRSLDWQGLNLAYTHNYVPLQPKPIGAIFSNAPQASMVQRLRDADIPIVWASQLQVGGEGRDGCVLVDRKSGGLLAGEKFAERRFRNWGYITFSENTFEDPLALGLREQARTHGAVLHECHLEHLAWITDSSRKYEAQLEAIARWLRDAPKPLAVLAFNYAMSVRVMMACNAATLTVPEQVAVACYGESKGMCQTAPVPLSTIDTNLAYLGRQAVLLLKRLADGESAPRQPIYVPAKRFVERRSTDILAVSDPRVARAVRFIWDNVEHSLSVNDVARAVGVSRSMLEKLFRAILNRGVNAELIRKRLELCKELLHSTKMPLTDIAQVTGLNSTRHLHRSFKNTFGMTPAQYRKSWRVDK